MRNNSDISEIFKPFFINLSEILIISSSGTFFSLFCLEGMMIIVISPFIVSLASKFVIKLEIFGIIFYSYFFVNSLIKEILQFPQLE